LADTEAKICPHFCAPSPESETISSTCSFVWITFFGTDSVEAAGSLPVAEREELLTYFTPDPLMRLRTLSRVAIVIERAGPHI